MPCLSWGVFHLLSLFIKAKSAPVLQTVSKALHRGSRYSIFHFLRTVVSALFEPNDRWSGGLKELHHHCCGFVVFTYQKKALRILFLNVQPAGGVYKHFAL